MPVQKPARRNKRGRPSSFKPEYCDHAIEMGRAGKSLHQIAASLDISYKCLWEWKERYPEFGNAITRARDLAQAFYEQIAVDNLNNREFNSKLWEIIARCRFPDTYREHAKVEVSGHEGGPIEIILKASREILREEAEKREAQRS